MTDPLNGQGLCRDEDPEMFFPASYSSNAGLLQVEEARAVCTGCPVAAGCLRDALATEAGKGIRARQKNGIRGGWTPRDRARGRIAQTRRHGLAA